MTIIETEKNAKELVKFSSNVIWTTLSCDNLLDN